MRAHFELDRGDSPKNNSYNNIIYYYCFHCCQVKGETRIRALRGNDENIVRSIVGYDANALYLWCTAQSMPMGHSYVYWRSSESGLLELAYEPNVSGKQNAWLAELVWTFPHLRYAIKNGEQHIGLKNLKVNEYCPQLNTAFEFDVVFITAANM